jgi:hypothetical protein
MVEFMHPTNIEQDYIKYAAQVTFELHYSCTDSENCFTVQTRWNGVPMGLLECVTRKDPEGTVCSLDNFKEHIENIWYDGDLDEGCE